LNLKKKSLKENVLDFEQLVAYHFLQGRMIFESKGMAIVIKEACSSKQRASHTPTACRRSKPGTAGKVAQSSNAHQIHQTREEQDQALEG